MEPVLSSGDRILIDTSRRVPVPPGIFVIWDGMGLVAKKIEHVPNSDPPKIVIHSVNPDYQTYERVRTMLRAPELVARTLQHDGISEDEAIESLAALDPVWEELFPMEQARVVRLLVAEIEQRTVS